MLACHRHRSSAVTINAPSHSERGKLVSYALLLHTSVTGLALDTGNFYVLRVIEIGQVVQIMHPYPLNRFFIGTIDSCSWVVIQGRVNLLNFCLTCVGRSLYILMAIHAHVGRRNSGCLAFLCSKVTVLTVNSIITGMYFMRESNGLLRLISLRNTYGRKCIPSFNISPHEQNNQDKSNEFFIVARPVNKTL